MAALTIAPGATLPPGTYRLGAERHAKLVAALGSDAPADGSAHPLATWLIAMGGIGVEHRGAVRRGRRAAGGRADARVRRARAGRGHWRSTATYAVSGEVTELAGEDRPQARALRRADHPARRGRRGRRARGPADLLDDPARGHELRRRHRRRGHGRPGVRGDPGRARQEGRDPREASVPGRAGDGAPPPRPPDRPVLAPRRGPGRQPHPRLRARRRRADALRALGLDAVLGRRPLDPDPGPLLRRGQAGAQALHRGASRSSRSRTSTTSTTCRCASG